MIPKSVIEKRHRRQLNERRKRKARRSEPVVWEKPLEEVVVEHLSNAQKRPRFLDVNVLRRTVALFMSKGLR